MGHGVDTGVRGNAFGTTDGEGWIHNSQIGHHGIRAHGALKVVHVGAEHGILCHFGSGAGGGGHGDEGNRLYGNLLALTDVFHIIDGRGAVGDQRSDGLANIDVAAPADGHDRIAAKSQGALADIVHLLDGGFAGNFTDNQILFPHRLELCLDVAYYRGLYKEGIDHYEKVGSQGINIVFKFLDSALFKNNFLRC